jgi:hypothetical protein
MFQVEWTLEDQHDHAGSRANRRKPFLAAVGIHPRDEGAAALCDQYDNGDGKKSQQSQRVNARAGEFVGRPEAEAIDERAAHA